MQINALKDATITSSAGKVVVAAKDEILLTSGGAYIKIKDGNIELGCPKMVWVKCAGFQVMGPSSLNVKTPLLPTTGIYSRRFDFSHIFAKDILEQGLSYQVIHRGQNSETFEKLDHDGRTSRFFGDTQDEIEVAVIGKLTEDGKWRLTEEKHCDLHDECCCGAEDEQDYQENTDEDVDDINTDDLIEDFNNFGN